jgi:parallel beta-helix repeat protein
MGGDNSNQLIEYVHSFDPRSWTCLHIAEGPHTCNGVVIQNNDLGPCGIDTFQEWADGISLACRNSIVRGNMILGATDGGIVVFGSPGSLIENNTIWVTNVCRFRYSTVNSGCLTSRTEHSFGRYQPRRLQPL